jgi:hypothetical protein
VCRHDNQSSVDPTKSSRVQVSFQHKTNFLFPAVCLSVCVFKLKVYRPSCQKSRRALCLPFLGLFELLIPLPNVIYRVYSAGCSSTTTFGLPE